MVITLAEWKKRSDWRKHCRAGCSKAEPKNSPRRRPLPGGAGRPKFNQLEMVTTFTYTFGEDRCTTQFRVIVVTDPHTNTHTHKQTGPITIHCAAAIARSVINYTATAELIESGFHTLRLEPNRGRTFNRREAITKRFLPLVTWMTITLL